MFHISDIKKFNNCHKLYYLDKDSHGSFFNYLKNEYSLTDLMIKLFNLDNPFIGQVGDKSDKVLNDLNNHTSFINARFEYDGMRIKPFLLIRKDNSYDLYFFHTFIQKELDLNTYYINYDVLIKNNINIDHIYSITVNNQYVLEGEFNPLKAFNISDEFNGIKIIELVMGHDFDYKSVMNEISNLSDDVNNNYPIKRNCLICNHLNECYKDMISDDSILHLVSSQNKFDMYEEGLFKLKDFDINRLEGTSLQYAQIMASRNNGLYIDNNAVKKFMDKMKDRPISFIDFEWDTYLLPKYEKMKCYGSLPFEFCLYILDEFGNLENKTYVGLDDCREEFINKLIEALPNDGPIVAFNSFSAEVLRIKELAEQFPKYNDTLNKIAKRFVDLADPFSKGMLYDIRFGGKLSVKSLVSIIDNVDYQKLNVKDGLDAVYNYRKYINNKDENIKNNLIEYCNQDSYSLYIIYNYLHSLIKE